MRDATAFDRAEFLGPARGAKRDPYRLELFARHLEPDESPAAVLSVGAGTLVITDRRMLRLASHLETDGAWNVREFQGYVVEREISLESIASAEHIVREGAMDVEDVLRLRTPEGTEEVLLSRGPDRVVPDEDADRLLTILTRRSPSRGPSGGASRSPARSPGSP